MSYYVLVGSADAETAGMAGVFQLHSVVASAWIDIEMRCALSLYQEGYSGSNSYCTHSTSRDDLSNYIKMETIPKSYEEIRERYPEYFL